MEMMPTLAEWLKIHTDTLDLGKGWLFAAPEKHRTLAKLDPVYVREMADSHCGDLMQRYFPDVSLESAIARRNVVSTTAQ